MAVDLEAIARRGRCDVSSLRIALPLLEQGYSPPFLARYRRDELSGIDEASLWELAAALHEDQTTSALKEDLLTKWEATALHDPAIGNAIRKTNSTRILDRLARRIKQESSETQDPSKLLAVRILNPQRGDGNDLAAIAAKIDGVEDAGAAIAGLDSAIVKRLVGDPRVVSAAVRWLAKNARVHVASISDPHIGASDSEATADDATDASQSEVETTAVSDPAAPEEPEADATTTTPSVEVSADSSATQENAPVPESTSNADAAVANTESAALESANSTDTTPTDTAASDSAVLDISADTSVSTGESSTPSADSLSELASSDTAASPAASATVEPTAEKETESSTKKATPKAAKKKDAKAPKKSKKVSPRQRRRRWLVSVLKPLAGKRFSANKLSSFQVVMLGRALRSQVAQCSFEYDAAKLVAELKRVAGGLNRPLEAKLAELVLENEGTIREAAESAWWDELHERASRRLVGIAADHLRRQVNRGSVDATVVMSIDAVGPRTAATSIVSMDGRVLHCEDLPCQMSAAQRTQAVAKMGELIHAHHVDLIVISNGPARRACMVAVGDLIGQSPEGSVRWTLADRSGADAYAGSDIANQEMRSTSRRFRAAAWLAFSILQPAHALSKVDPLKLRLASFQRELSDDAMRLTLENVMVSGASRGGVDANSASASALQRLPGMTTAAAEAIDKQRRESLIKSRDELLELDIWDSVASSRQSLPFLRVFGSNEVLDGTLIHPDDYALATKLVGVLGLELPPDCPPGYTPPVFTKEEKNNDGPGLKEASAPPETPVVEDLSQASANVANEDFGAEVTTEESSDGESTASSEESEAVPDDGAEASTDDSTASSDSEPSAESKDAEASDSEPATTEDSAESAATGEPATDKPDSEIAAAGEEATSDDTSSDQTEAAASVSEPVRQPRPEKAKIDKCIKEWQVGANRVNQLVSWLCDPFGDSDDSGVAPGVLNSMPSHTSLKEGDQVIGVVVGVMPFGVFVELAPDCSGLIHVSKVTDTFVEDLHEAIQVGDVVTAWVTGIDTKKKRVALSAVSPQREAELREERAQRSNSRDGRPQRGQRRGDRSSGGGGQGKGSQARKTGSQQGGRGSSDRGGPSRGKSGAGRDNRGGGRGRDSGRGRGGRRERKPESYNVVGKKVDKPISDAMQKGEEPLRSFGDLLQFYGKGDDASKEQPADEAPKQQKDSAAKPQSAQKTESAKTESEKVDSEPTDTASDKKQVESEPSAPAPADEKVVIDSPSPEVSSPTSSTAAGDETSGSGEPEDATPASTDPSNS